MAIIGGVKCIIAHQTNFLGGPCIQSLPHDDKDQCLTLFSVGAGITIANVLIFGNLAKGLQQSSWGPSVNGPTLFIGMSSVVHSWHSCLRANSVLDRKNILINSTCSFPRCIAIRLTVSYVNCTMNNNSCGTAFIHLIYYLNFTHT